MGGKQALAVRLHRIWHYVSLVKGLQVDAVATGIGMVLKKLEPS
jgi:hypothetical protein